MNTTNYKHILAKSTSNGGVSLLDHLVQVKIAALAIADYLGMDKNIVTLGAILHDIGKASVIFQERLKREFNWITARPFRHELASLFFISLVDENIRPQIIEMIVGHHKSIKRDYNGFGILDLNDDCANPDDPFDWHIGGWETWSKDALGILKILGFNVKEISIQEAKENYFFALAHCQKVYNDRFGWNPWKGLLMAADVFASCFAEKTANACSRLFQNPDLKYYNRQSEFHPLSLISATSKKLHTIAIASTGAGKTDFLIRRCKGRFFYVLPFQASINAMYRRIKDELKDLNPGLNISLLHGSSNAQRGIADTEEKLFHDKVGAAIKVLTPHQLAGIVFGIRGYEAMILDIKGCDVILDEIHTYNKTTKAIVLKIVEMLVHFGCRIHIGTATMPRKLYDLILDILGRKNVQEVKLSNKVLDSFDRHIVHKIQNWSAAKPVIAKAILERQKVLIVCNRVKTAQEIYDDLIGEHPGIEEMLIHSRFERNDRANKEKDLINKFNKYEEKACIVISTQVVEVSLDINFDVLITECAPLDSLVQRFGRINRKRNEETIGKYKPVYIIKPPDNAEAAQPYELDILKKSFDILPDNKLLRERELQKKIDAVFADLEQTNLDSHSIFNNGKFIISELTHKPDSVFLDIIDIDSVTCIRESQVEKYLDSQTSDEEKINMEIPVRYGTIASKGLGKIRNIGTAPFIVPDIAYSYKKGLVMSLADPKNYKQAYYDCLKNRQNFFDRI